MTRPLALLLALCCGLLATTAAAHKASDAFLYLDNRGATATLRVDVALRDIALLTSLDSNRDGQVTGAELRSARSAIIAAVTDTVRIEDVRGSSCTLRGASWGLSRHSDGAYAAGRWHIQCPQGESPGRLTYNLLFDRDPLHRGLIQVIRQDGEQLAVLSPDQRHLALTGARPSAIGVFASFVQQGVIHLLLGLDHLLFLLVLILPATFRQRPAREGGLRARLSGLVRVVTAFTVAHSITLALAALDIVRLPVAWVELVIAFSIAVAAINTVWPFLGKKTWKLAFGFGLVHGFGFASVLAELTSGLSGKTLALAGFNLGVELGQLAVLLVTFPLLYLLAGHRLYRRAAVPMVVLGVCGMSVFWMLERAGAL